MFEAKHVQAYRELFQSLPKNEQDLPAMSAAMKKFTAHIENDDTLANKLNQLLFPVFAQAEAAFAKMQAEKRVSLLAVKLLRMRPEGLPADLSKFGALAIDPLTGKSMLYVRKGGGFKVWSVGGDLNDNGGRKRGTGVNYKDTDIVLGYRIGIPPPTKKPVNLPPGSPSAIPGVVGP
jgi:hypothetical protein